MDCGGIAAIAAGAAVYGEKGPSLAERAVRFQVRCRDHQLWAARAPVPDVRK
jgi:L-amino acid N-acyltransferase YncA